MKVRKQDNYSNNRSNDLYHEKLQARINSEFSLSNIIWGKRNNTLIAKFAALL